MEDERPDISGYLTVTEAAEFLGVSSSTLRNWDRSGKLEAKRHPFNGYRLYLRAELEVVLVKIRAGERVGMNRI